MFEQLIQIDRSWLLAINGAHAPWADALFWQISRPETWIPLYVVLLIALSIRLRGQRSTILGWSVPSIVPAVVMIAIAVGCSDLVCAQVIKPLVARLRPTHDEAILSLVHVVNGYRGGAYGFCSNHAANTMACAVLCTALFAHGRSWQTHLYVTLPLVLWVVMNCYSRMYLGVHYPLDILAGILVGGVIAWLVWLSAKHCLFPIEEHVHRDAEGSFASVRTAQE